MSKYFRWCWLCKGFRFFVPVARTPMIICPTCDCYVLPKEMEQTIERDPIASYRK